MKPFVLVFSVGFGALVLGGCSPSHDTISNSEANLNSSSSDKAVANEAVSNAAIVPTTTSTPTPSERASLVSNVWVPGKDDKLHQQPVSKAALDAQKKYGNPTAALEDIVRMAPKWFPPKTRVLQWHNDGKTISVNLNRNFATSDFWSKSGTTATQLAVYALVNSATVDGKPVVLEVEKRPVSEEELGGFDASDAIEPNRKLQATEGAPLPKADAKAATTKANAAAQSGTPKTATPKSAAPRATMSPAISALPDADFSSPKTGNTVPKAGAR